MLLIDVVIEVKMFGKVDEVDLKHAADKVTILSDNENHDC